MAVATGIGRFAFTPILPTMREALHLSPTDLALLASVNYLGYLAGAVAAATPLLPARMHDQALRVSLVGVVAMTALMPATSSMNAWLVVRFLAGVASAGIFVVGSGVVLGWLARQRRLDLSGWYFSGVGFGIASSGAVVLALEHLPSNAGGWRLEWLGVTLLAAALAALSWAWLPRSGNPPRRGPEPATAASGWVSFPIVLLGAAYFLAGAGYIVAGTFLVAIVAEVPGLSGLGASAWILVGLAAVPSTVFWTRIAVAFGPVAALVVVYVVQAIGLALPVLWHEIWAVAVSALLFGGTFMGVTALTIGEARRLAPPLFAAQAIGALTAAFGLGQVLGPLLATRVAGDTGDFRPALLDAAGAVGLGAILVLWSGMVASSRERGKAPQ
jgi:predicted MFS family arabinose efflux permease